LEWLTNERSFAEKVLRGLKGEQGIVEPSYVYLPGVDGGDAIAKETGVDFFSVPIQLGVSLHPDISLQIPSFKYNILTSM
jgi:hypothetical protein